MKKIIALCVLLATFAMQAQGNSAYKNAAIEFVKITSDEVVFDNAIQQLGQKVDDANFQKFQTEAHTTLDKLYGNMAELFMAEFSHEELKTLIAFYKTDLGKKFAQKQLRISQQAMQLGVNWGDEVQDIAKKYIKQ